MKKEEIYFALGSMFTSVGACMIHVGLGLILVGVWFFVGSYIEFNNHYNEED